MKRKYESIKKKLEIEKLAKALKETFGYKLKSDDKVKFVYEYSDHNIVDVEITRKDGKHGTVAAYHKLRGSFPW